jgi:hypothetical protein
MKPLTRKFFDFLAANRLIIKNSPHANAYANAFSGIYLCITLWIWWISAVSLCISSAQTKRFSGNSREILGNLGTKLLI